MRKIWSYLTWKMFQTGKKYFKNYLMGYLNINSIRNQIIDLREIVKYLELDSFVISKAKNNESFPSQQFATDGQLMDYH